MTNKATLCYQCISEDVQDPNSWVEILGSQYNSGGNGKDAILFVLITNYKTWDRLYFTAGADTEEGWQINNVDGVIIDVDCQYQRDWDAETIISYLFLNDDQSCFNSQIVGPTIP